MEDIKFRSLNELYTRVYPALKSKKKELQRNGISYIHEEDIWNCCKELIWVKKDGLSLYNMVDDILNTSNNVFDNYIKDIISSSHREINRDED